MTSSNGNTCRVTGLWCGEFTDHRWIALTKASDALRLKNTIFHCDTGNFRSIGVNMLRPEHNGGHCEDDTFKCIFLYESRFSLIQKYRSKFHWNVLKRAQLTIKQHWLRLWHWSKQAPSKWANDNQSNDALYITMQASMCQMTWEHALTCVLLYASIN